MIPVASHVARLNEHDDPIFSLRWAFYELPLPLFERLRFMAVAAGVDLVWTDSCVLPSTSSDNESFVFLKNFAVVDSTNAYAINDIVTRYSVENSMSTPFTVNGSVKAWKAWNDAAEAVKVTVCVESFVKEKRFLAPADICAVVRLVGEYTSITDFEETPTSYGLQRRSAPSTTGAQEYAGMVLEEGLDAHVGYLYFLLEGLQHADSSIQDSLFVDRALTSYLPEAIALFTPFGDESHPAHVEAVTLFRKQLYALEEQIIYVSEKNEKNELNAMKAHLLFLESKKENTTL